MSVSVAPGYPENGMWCIYCGHEWVAKSLYCRSCGLLAERGPGRSQKLPPDLLAQLIVVVAGIAVILWLARRPEPGGLGQRAWEREIRRWRPDIEPGLNANL